MTFKRLGFGIALLGLAACATGRPSGVMPQNSLDTLVKGAQQNINSLDLALAIPCPDRGGGWTAAGTFIGAAPPTSRADFRALLAEEGVAYNDAIKAVDERIRTAKRNYAFVYSTIPEELRNLNAEADRDRKALAEYHSSRTAALFGRHVAYVLDVAARDMTRLPANWAADSRSHPYFAILTTSNVYNQGWDLSVTGNSIPGWTRETAGAAYFGIWQKRAEECTEVLRRQLFEAHADQLVAEAAASGRSSAVSQMRTAEQFRSVVNSSPTLKLVSSELAAIEQQFRGAEDEARRVADAERRAAEARAAQQAAAEEAERLRLRAENDRVWRAAWRRANPISRNFICEGRRHTSNELGTAILDMFGLPNATAGDPFGFQARFNEDFSVMEASLANYAGIGAGRHAVTFVGPSRVEYPITYEVKHGGGRTVTHTGAAVVDLATGQLRGAINWQAPIVGTRSTDVWNGYCSAR